jgi:YfiH family protein
VSNVPDPRWIVPEWPAAPRVRAIITTRFGGVSGGPYASLNLGLEVGDDAECVARNRAVVRGFLPAEPVWLKQMHGATVLDGGIAASGREADAVITRSPRTVCAVLTADCLPVLVCDRAGRVAGAVHAGWRGLAAGILQAVVRRMGVSPREVLAYLGPGIGPSAYEVGAELRQTFVEKDAKTSVAFAAKANGKFLADLYQVARVQLAETGVGQVYGGGFCTASEERFFSYRRDGITGRMASLIWLEDNQR